MSGGGVPGTDGWQDSRVYEPRWAVVIPVKALGRAKSRLRGAPVAVPHDRLVLAMALDTIGAVLECPAAAEALVVTDDPVARAAFVALGARVVPDEPAAGMNAALGYGAALAARPGRWVAALAADLPALRPEELTAALGAAREAPGRGFVPDAAGTGTALLTTPPGVALAPRFGPASAAAHAASGAFRLAGDWPSLARDVDTFADLLAAARLGLGPHTRAACPPSVLGHAG
jgi:2-phospho-L-lactate guanylyltransferase